MIDFMVIGLGRCGTTWAANWLTGAGMLCHHDPLRLAPMEAWDRKLAIPGRSVGVACTGAWLWPGKLNAHPARKVILHRPLAEVEASYRRMGAETPMLRLAERLDEIEGLHVGWSALFDPQLAKAVWSQVTDAPFDAERHAALAQMNIQPAFGQVVVDAEATRALAAKLAVAVGGR